jgi:AAHS family 4-hydroxybenzoate transporter-like MFS transporter
MRGPVRRDADSKSDVAGGSCAGPVEVDVGAVIDRAPFRGLPLLVFVLTAAAMILDGFDIQIIAFAAPALIGEFGLSRADLGPILAAGLGGMAIGGFALGQLGDRVGRRAALSLSLAIVGIGALGSAFASGPDELFWWRLGTGVGLGGVVPNCAATISEWAPVSVRNAVVATTIVGVPVGGVLGAELAAQIIPLWGWRALFLIGAALPIMLAVVVLMLMPESPRHLARRGGDPQVLGKLLSRISGNCYDGPGTRFVIREQGNLKAGGLGALLHPAYRRDTVLIWVLFLTNMVAVYAFFNWLPMVLSAAGLPLQVSLRGALAFNLGGVVSAVVLAAVVTRVGSRLALRYVSVGAIVTTLVLAFVGPDASGSFPAFSGVALVLLVMSLAGACIIGMQVVAYALAAHVYPTAVRATGVGWAATMARIGGILASVAGGAVFALGAVAQSFFMAVAVVLVFVLAAALLIERQIPPREVP